MLLKGKQHNNVLSKHIINILDNCLLKKCINIQDRLRNVMVCIENYDTGNLYVETIRGRLARFIMV